MCRWLKRRVVERSCVRLEGKCQSCRMTERNNGQHSDCEQRAADILCEGWDAFTHRGIMYDALRWKSGGIVQVFSIGGLVCQEHVVKNIGVRNNCWFVHTGKVDLFPTS